MEIVYVFIGLIIFIAFIVIILLKSGEYEITEDEARRRAGRRGELAAKNIIESVLNDEDYLVTNIEINIPDGRTEIDCVVVNKHGVFIFEVKNYVGELYGDEDDYEWEQQKITRGGYVYPKLVKNPIKQVKRQTYLIATYLRESGIDVWVEGYAILLHVNSPVDSPVVISNVDEIDDAIHTLGKNRLSKAQIEVIKKLLV